MTEQKIQVHWQNHQQNIPADEGNESRPVNQTVIYGIKTWIKPYFLIKVEFMPGNYRQENW